MFLFQKFYFSLRFNFFYLISISIILQVAEQIDVFHSIVKLSSEDVISRHTVCKEVEKILKSFFPTCFVCLVGSSVNGLGLKGCDVDLSLQFSDRQNNMVKYYTYLNILFSYNFIILLFSYM